MWAHRLAMLLIGGLLLTGSAVRAADVVRVVTPVRPPYVVDAGAGVADGPSIRLLQRVAELAGVAPAIEVVPFERAILMLHRGNALYPALLRTPAREGRYQWVGEVFTDTAVVFTGKPAPVIRSLGEARVFGTVTVMRGSELAALMRAEGLTNIGNETSDLDNARMLAAGRVDAWLAPSTVGRAVWDELHLDPAILQASAPVAALSFWIVASKNFDPAILARLRNAYAELVKTSEYDRIVAPLRGPTH